jgi:hypothetical protein
MVQKEKQEHMLRTAKKKYGKNIRITFAEKDVLRFVTDTLAVTMKCHNNGVIDERTRKRPKMKSSALSPKDERPKAKPIQKSAPRTIPKRKASSKADLPETDPEDPTSLSTSSEPKCPFHVGDHVKSLYSDAQYTVSAIESYSLVHVTEEGDLFGRIMSSADLVGGTKPRKRRDSAD